MYSIAIPTYNRADQLIGLLDRIHEHFPAEVEIVIRDNNSSDETVQKVLNWIETHAGRKTVFNRNNTNLGIDANILKVIEDCSFSWVKLFGDDDGFDPDIISRIEKFHSLPERDDYALLYFNFSEWNRDLTKKSHDKSINYHKDLILVPGVNIITIVAEVISFLSSLFINKDDFKKYADQIPQSIKQGGIEFVWVVMKALKHKSSAFIADPLVYWNNADPERGVKWQRYAVKDLMWIINDTAPNLSHEVFKLILNRYIIPRCRMIGRGNSSYIERINMLLFLTKYFYKYKKYWMEAVPRLLSPEWLYKIKR